MDLRRRYNRGHNLLEAIIAGIIFSVVAVFLMGIWDMQFKAMLKSKETAIASFLAERVMEECIAAGFDGVDELYDGEPKEIVVHSRTKKGESDTTYTFDVKINEPPYEHPDSTQKTVVVIVSYSDSTGERSVQYHTVLNQHG